MENIYYHNLSFSFGKKVIVKNQDLVINSGAIIGLIGKNGVGKSTLLKIICNLDKNYNEVRFNFVINKPAFYPELTGYQNLHYLCILYHVNPLKIDEVLKRVYLYNARKIKYEKYSLGMKQRLALSKWLLLDSDIYVFDEPTNGLDFEGIKILNSIIMDLIKRNKTIIMASHDIHYLKKFCNTYWLLDKGIIHVLSLNELERTKIYE